MRPKVHIVSYTHWDREFRWEFEHTRMKLVECIDHLLEIMEQRPAYKSFLMDGQIDLIDDYLEIRPEREPVIRQLVAEGRLEIGPWYTLPDCATVNGESVIRNLRHGVKVSRSYGSVLLCGYNVFSFGQIAQLPQIYRHFGIDTIMFYKHLNPKRTRFPEFIWEAPDGTQAYATRLGREARWNFFFAGHIPIVCDRDPWDRGWRYDYGTLGKVVHTADPEGHAFFHEIVDPETSYHSENMEMGFKRSLETVSGTAVPETLLFFDGTDFTEPHPMTPEIIAELQEKFGGEYEILHSQLSAYLTELKDALGRLRDQLDVVSGPMRDGPVGAVHSDVLSIHPEIKLANAATENRLLHYAEPLATMAWAFGTDRYPETQFDRAWKLLFQSHAHDSVHGLGPHELSEGVVANIKRAGLIAQGAERRALNHITKEIDTAGIEDATTFLVVHNTAAFSRSEVVEAWVDIPAEVALDEVAIEDMQGSLCELQEVDRATTRAGIYHPRSRNMPYYCTRVQVLFLAERVPALGYKTYKLKWRAKRDYPYPHEDWEPPRVVENDLLAGPGRARNEHVELLVNPDGTFSVTDRATGQTYAGLNYLLDTGDNGNMWMSNTPDQDAMIHSRGRAAEVACTCHGPLGVVFEIAAELEVPARFDFGNRKRSDERSNLRATTRLTLRKGSRYVEARTTIDNRARDHHLRVCFPTGLVARTTCADGSFSVTTYPTRPDLSCELARHPAQLWFDLHDGERGLAVLSRSTKDYEVIDEKGTNTLAMGLLRAVRLRIPCDNRLWMEYPGDESSQALGESTHEYAVLPHRKAWQEDALYRDAQAFNQPLKCVQFGKQDGGLPPELSLGALDHPNLVLSAVTKAEGRDSVLVRFFNPSQEAISTTLRTGFDFASAHKVKLTEEREAKLADAGRSAELKVGRGEIVTVELEVRRQHSST
jgi:mannosylglycerate hydrolase